MPNIKILQYNLHVYQIILQKDFGTIHLRRQHVLGGGVSPCADGQKVTVHKDQKSPS